GDKEPVSESLLLLRCGLSISFAFLGLPRPCLGFYRMLPLRLSRGLGRLSKAPLLGGFLGRATTLGLLARVQKVLLRAVQFIAVGLGPIPRDGQADIPV